MEDSNSLDMLTKRRTQYQSALTVWANIFLTGTWLVMTILYAWAMTLASGSVVALVPSSAAHSIAVLQVLSGGATFLLMQLMGLTLEMVVWAIASSTKGITMTSFLAISPCTGIFGMLELLQWNRPHGAANLHRLWIVNRFQRY